MADYVMKRYDTYPPIFANLSDTNGIINLSAASQIKMIMKAQTGGTVISASCAIASALGGVVSHTWLATEVNQLDTWNLEWEILWNTASGVQTIPNDGYKTLLVEADLENG